MADSDTFDAVYVAAAAVAAVCRATSVSIARPIEAVSVNLPGVAGA